MDGVLKAINQDGLGNRFRSSIYHSLLFLGIRALSLTMKHELEDKKTHHLLGAILKVIREKFSGCEGRRTGSFAYKIGQPKTKKKAHPMLELKISNEQQIKVTLTPKTDTGKPAKLDGKPTWEVISGNSTVTVADDGLSADLVSSDDPGDTEVMVKADADIGDGVEEISDIVKLSVVGAMAKNLGLAAGQPTPKPVV